MKEEKIVARICCLKSCSEEIDDTEDRIIVCTNEKLLKKLPNNSLSDWKTGNKTIFHSYCYLLLSKQIKSRSESKKKKKKKL